MFEDFERPRISHNAVPRESRPLSSRQKSRSIDKRSGALAEALKQLQSRNETLGNELSKLKEENQTLKEENTHISNVSIQ